MLTFQAPGYVVHQIQSVFPALASKKILIALDSANRITVFEIRRP